MEGGRERGERRREREGGGKGEEGGRGRGEGEGREAGRKQGASSSSRAFSRVLAENGRGSARPAAPAGHPGSGSGSEPRGWSESRKPPRLVGGPMDASVEEEGVRRALDFAVSEYNKASNDMYHSRALQVVRARKQIVAGVNYFLDVELGRTTCTKTQPNLDNCPFHEQPHLKRKAFCSFQIYTVPWQGTMTLSKSTCQDA
uniref:Cystatin C n=2 Tax=Macaca TaxID=9539 RepID=A0A7N9DC00_MACFA